MAEPLSGTSRSPRRKSQELVMLSLFGARTVIPAAIILAVYALLPVADVVGQVGAGLVIVMALLVYTYLVIRQMRRLATSKTPLMLVGQSLVLAVVLFVAIFALGYAALSANNPSYFNEPLTKASALYFSMTVTSTVGFVAQPCHFPDVHGPGGAGRSRSRGDVRRLSGLQEPSRRHRGDGRHGRRRRRGPTGQG